MLCIALLGSLPIPGLWADEFSRLEVLPKDIERRELMEIMKGYARGLGVRCHHCHVGEEGLPLSEFDFASDAKPNKEVARSMIRMTRQINDSLAKLGREAVLEVSCVTCHHGQARPLTLEQVLAETLAKDGVAATVAHYRALRAEWYGRSTYDFGEATLRSLADEVARQPSSNGQGSEAAIALLQLNLEHYPDAVRSLVALAGLYQTSGQTELATTTYRRVLSLDPSNPQATQALQKDPP